MSHDPASASAHLPVDPPDRWRPPGHLIHIGYPKSASNALRRWFAGHPQLDFAEGAIAGFRDVYQIARDSAAARPGLLYRVTSSEGLAIPHPDFGRPTADYSGVDESDLARDQAAACAILRDLFPGAFILIVTRGFIGAIRSGFSQFIRSGGDPADFSQAQAHRRPIDTAGHPRNYDRVVGLYRDAFGDRVIVLPYELYRDDADAFVGEIERRLGLAHFPAPAERLNPSLDEAELAGHLRLTRLIRRLPVGRRARRRLTRLYARAAEQGRLGPLIRLLERLRPAPPPERLGDALAERFRGRAETLRGEPGFALHARDYLLDGPDGG